MVTSGKPGPPEPPAPPGLGVCTQLYYLHTSTQSRLILMKTPDSLPLFADWLFIYIWVFFKSSFYVNYCQCMAVILSMTCSSFYCTSGPDHCYRYHLSLPPTVATYLHRYHLLLPITAANYYCNLPPTSTSYRHHVWRATPTYHYHFHIPLPTTTYQYHQPLPLPPTT